MNEIEGTVITMEVTKKELPDGNYETLINCKIQPVEGAKYGAGARLTVTALVATAVDVILNYFPEAPLIGLLEQEQVQIKKLTAERLINETLKNYLNSLDLAEPSVEKKAGKENG